MSHGTGKEYLLSRGRDRKSNFKNWILKSKHSKHNIRNKFLSSSFIVFKNGFN